MRLLVLAIKLKGDCEGGGWVGEGQEVPRETHLSKEFFHQSVYPFSVHWKRLSWIA